jgi:hypothetical protein
MKYATLSYRWGEKSNSDEGSQPRTTAETLSRHLESIDYQSLPQTHKDALEICSCLGIEYLWIDALCIIQGSEEDWANEAARMKDVYSASALTIAANDAMDPRGGFFADLSSSDLKIYHEGKRYCFQFSPAGQDTKRLVHLENRGFMFVSPLARRGWPLQEIILSRRVVLVKNEELHWRCRRTFRTETGLQSILPSDFFTCEPLTTPRHLDALDVNANPWRSWMEDYSRRGFKCPDTDRLAALAGMVDYFAQTNDTPLLGLWRSTFGEDLQWTRTGQIPGGDVPGIPNIPSWSWLSYRGSVLFQTGYYGPRHGPSDIQCHINVKSVTVEWTGKPFVSRVKSSRLIVEAPMMELFIEEDANENYTIGKAGGASWIQSADSVVSFTIDNADSDKYLNKTHPCLIAGSQTLRAKKADDAHFFIIFEPTYDLVEGQSYRRVGSGSIRSSLVHVDSNALRTIHWV